MSHLLLIWRADDYCCYRKKVTCFSFVFSMKRCNRWQIPTILAHHELFLEELRKRLESWDSKQCVGGVFLEAVSGPFDPDAKHILLD